jgi:hypothetical protein
LQLCLCRNGFRNFFQKKIALGYTIGYTMERCQSARAFLDQPHAIAFDRDALGFQSLQHPIPATGLGPHRAEAKIIANRLADILPVRYHHNVIDLSLP